VVKAAMAHNLLAQKQNLEFVIPFSRWGKEHYGFLEKTATAKR
jgi:hypothetical protein